MVDAVLLNDTRADRHHGCTSVLETIDVLATANGINLIAYASGDSDWRKDATIIQAIDAADLIIVNGEGTIHHDRPAALALLAAGLYAKERGKRAALINATWQANSDAALRHLETFDVVSVRESASEAVLTGHGFSIRRIADLALYHQPRPSPSRSGVGYCDSVQGPKALAIYRQMWALGAQPLPIMNLSPHPRFVQRWIRRYGDGLSAFLDPRLAVSALRATVQDYRRQMSSRDEMTAAVAARELLVTGRFHALIFALAARTPMISFTSNTYKNEATLRDAGLEPWRIVDHPRAIDEALVEKAIRWHGQEEAALGRFIANNRAAMERLFADLAKLC